MSDFAMSDIGSGSEYHESGNESQSEHKPHKPTNRTDPLHNMMDLYALCRLSCVFVDLFCSSNTVFIATDFLLVLQGDVEHRFWAVQARCVGLVKF